MNEIERPEMTLRDYWRVLVRRKWIVLVGIFATVIPAVALSLAQTPVYQAEAQMIVQSLPGDSVFGSTYLGYVDPDRVVQNEIQVLESEVVSERLMTNLGLTTTPPAVTGAAVGSTDVIAARVRSSDPPTARVLADAYVQAYIDTKREQSVGGLIQAGTELQAKVSELQAQVELLDAEILTAGEAEARTLTEQRRLLVDQQALFKQRLDQLQVDAALTSGNAQLVRQATEPQSPIEPNTTRTGLLALVVGLLLGIGAAFLIDFIDDSVRSPETLAALAGGLPVLAVVPIDPPPDNRPIAISKPDDFAVETYRSLRTNVQFLGFDSALKAIQITSAMPGEGKTTTATNLAVVLAQAGSKVILVDADLRKPRVHHVFALNPVYGLTNALLGDPVDLAIEQIDEHLWVMPSGSVPPNPSEMLGGRRLHAVIEELKSRFDYVVIDSAPVLPVSDAIALSRQVDGVLVVTQAGRTSAPQVRQTLAGLEQVSAPVLGVVLNKASGRQSGAGYQYGYGGYGYQFDDAAKKNKQPAAT
jgi:polysaccharide biosynthesis transport protein